MHDVVYDVTSVFFIGLLKEQSRYVDANVSDWYLRYHFEGFKGFHYFQAMLRVHEVNFKIIWNGLMCLVLLDALQVLKIFYQFLSFVKFIFSRGY